VSKTRTNQPNNTRETLPVRMVHLSAQITRLGERMVLLTREYFRHGGAAMRGNTFNEGRNAAKRRRRELSKTYRSA
jgi:hypothetical protein